MKRKLMSLLFLIMLATVVYDFNSIVPKYRIEKGPQGTIKIYDAKDFVIPKYIIKGDRVFPAGKLVVPVFKIKKEKK